MNNTLKEILEKIEEYGFEAYVVGGYPRDLLLGRKTTDYDICTNARKEDLEKIFDIKLTDNFGSVTHVYKGVKFEITTYRKEECYFDIRTPKITYAKTLEEDIIRRDFTINTICMNAKGEYIDLLNGRDDLNKKIIRAVGNAHQKLSEDPLRILRAIRFASVLNFTLDECLEEAILENAPKVSNLSFFRKKQELDKIFRSGGIKLLEKYHLDKYLGIDISDVINVNSALLIWAQLENIEEFPFTRKEKKAINELKLLLKDNDISKIDLSIYDEALTNNRE